MKKNIIVIVCWMGLFEALPVSAHLPFQKLHYGEVAFGSTLLWLESGQRDFEGNLFSLRTSPQMHASLELSLRHPLGAVRGYGNFPFLNLGDKGGMFSAGGELMFELSSSLWISAQLDYLKREGEVLSRELTLPFESDTFRSTVSVHANFYRFWNAMFGLRHQLYETPVAISVISGQKDAPVIFTELATEFARVQDVLFGGGVEANARYMHWFWNLGASVFLGPAIFDEETRRELLVSIGFGFNVNFEAGIGYQIWKVSTSRGIIKIGGSLDIHMLAAGTGAVTDDTASGERLFRPGRDLEWNDFLYRPYLVFIVTF